MKERFKLERPLHEKNALREFIQSQDVFVNLPTAGFPASSERCSCAAVYSTISLTLAIKHQNKSGNHDIHAQKKLHTCSYSGPDISEKTKETNKYKDI